MNLAQYVAMPKKLRISFTQRGAGAFLIAETFAGSAEMPSDEKTRPKNVSLF
jgi:hypothetical protein